MTTIQVRIDEDTKKSAQKILDEVGLDMSSAIKVYLKQIIVNNGIPMRLVTENGLTWKREKAILKASADAKAGKNITEPMNAKDAINYLKKM